MKRYSRLLDFLKDESGATAVEYAIILLLIGVACIGAFNTAGSSLEASLNDTASKVPG